MCTVLPSHGQRRERLVTTALAFIEPRFDQTRTQPPGLMPFSFGELLGDLDEEFRLQRSH